MANLKELLRLKTPKNMIETGIPRSAYVHIPFCRRRCYYCDFPISVLGNKTNINTAISIEEYVDRLCQEIALTPPLGSSLETVFFGGGTPSLLPVKFLERILAAIDRRFGIASQAEISLEMDPGTFTRQQLQGYQQAGVNRVSLGVQAFEDELLQICGRFHTGRDIFTGIDIIRQVGIANLSLDLISGLPHQTLEQWQFALETCLKIAPNHISCYDLVLEPVTAFGKKYQPGKKPMPTDTMTANMYRLAQQILTDANYQHYEISNYAQPGYQCRHNLVYWENRPYYGFGMGSTSYIQGQRFTRPRTRQQYYTWVKQLRETGFKIDCPKLSKTDIILETIMLRLRLSEGISIILIRNLFGDLILKKMAEAWQSDWDRGWLIGTGYKGESIKIVNETILFQVARIKLTDPEGFLFSNTVLSALFQVLDN